MKYSVTLIYDATRSLQVEAETAEDALDIASEKAGMPSLCHQCSREVDLGDVSGHVIEGEDGVTVESGFAADWSEAVKQRNNLAALLAKYSKRGLSPVLTEDELEEIDAALAEIKGGGV